MPTLQRPIRSMVFLLTVIIFGIASPIVDGETIVIEGSNFQWSVNGNPVLEIPVAAGDQLIWKNVGGSHGVVFDSEAEATAFLEFETTGLPTLGPQTVDGTGVWGTAALPAGDLAQAVVKEGVAAGTVLTFFCTRHGTDMGSSIKVEPANENEPIVIEGSNFKWSVNGNQVLEIPVVAGDQLIWKNVGGSHGVVFDSEADATAILEFETTGLPSLGPQTVDGAVVWGTAALPVGDLAKAVVKEDIAAGTQLTFFCTRHGTGMGSTLIANSEGPPDASSMDEVVQAMSPNIQRRMLRFVNRARKPMDLTRSPQERREKFEHGPSGAKPKSDLRHEDIIAYDLETAKVMIENRPLDGYTDVRECLKLYPPNRDEALSQLLGSLGPQLFGEWREEATVAQFVNGQEEPVMHAAMLHTNKVLLIPNNDKTVIWDPFWDPTVPGGAPSSIQILNGGTQGTGLTANLFCSGHSFLTDGRLLVVGGGGGGPGEASSIEGWKFDPERVKWSRTANNMSFQRWYPTLVTLAESPGRVLVAGGMKDRFGALSDFMDVYSESTDRFEPVTSAGPVGELLFPFTYPGLHLLPGGEMFHVPVGFANCNQSPSSDSTDPTAVFTFSNAQKTQGAWTTFQNNHRAKGMSALLLDSTSPSVRGLVIGGGDVGTSATGQTIDLTTFSPNWDSAFPLLEARIHPNVVLLPDGNAFICGGMEELPKPPPNGGRCEMYNPNTGSISEMDELHSPRHYHSVAILLPTGEVMATGGAGAGGCDVSRHNVIEVFRPPYLFRKDEADRPKILSVREDVERGAAFEIDTARPLQISRVVLARPMAVTHQTDSEQRMINLQHTVTGPGTVEAIAPGGTGNSIAPPGYYMLFILDQDGVPSIAKWILLK